MKTFSIIIGLVVLSHLSYAQKSIPTEKAQIALAVLAAPEEGRKDAKVYGYSADGQWTVLREGTNEYICIADDPLQKGFQVSCYHKALEPFMERGRELKKEGKSFREIFDTREEEVKSGKLYMPEKGATLYVLTAEEQDMDIVKGKVNNTHFRYVVYIPYATVESTGLPLKPEAPGMPWIMDPGTHRAHIMITPPSEWK